MKITKFGHCCLLIEEKGVKILTDPGFYTTEQNNIKDLDVVLITHEHQDHLHLESLKIIMANNPTVVIISNSAVGKILSVEKISFHVIEDGQSENIKGVIFSGSGTKHAEIFEEYGQVLNTGYFIGERLFYPGDALHNPGRPVEILAFPTPGSWANMKESISYVFEVNPIICFPVHDGAFRNTDFMYNTFSFLIPKKGPKVVLLKLNKETEL